MPQCSFLKKNGEKVCFTTRQRACKPSAKTSKKPCPKPKPKPKALIVD